MSCVVMSDVYKKSTDIMNHIKDEYGLCSSYISPSVEDGFCIFYKKETDEHDWSLIIEVYEDDLEVACIIADNKKKEVIYREDIVDDDFSRAVQAFIR